MPLAPLADPWKRMEVAQDNEVTRPHVDFTSIQTVESHSVRVLLENAASQCPVFSPRLLFLEYLRLHALHVWMLVNSTLPILSIHRQEVQRICSSMIR